jgi:hypothetical protein
VLLASSPYSGSTLLSALLAGHPDIASVSDVSGRRREHRMDAFRCSCGALMRECRFWRRVQDEARGFGLDDLRLANFELGFDHGLPGRLARWRTGSLRWGWLEGVRDVIIRLLPGQDAALRRIGRRNRAFAAAVASVAKGSAFVDASKERLRARYLRRYTAPDLRVIHLFRDPRGYVLSARGHASHAATDIRALARDWVGTNAALDRAADDGVSPSRFFVSYERLCADPGGTLRELQAFCGVEPTGELEMSDLHLLGNRVRLASIEAIRLDERWRTELTAAEQATILAIAGETHRRLLDRMAAQGA